MKEACLCGRVTVEVARAPDYLNFCNCRFCRASGAGWGYFTTAEVSAEGTTQSYRREDMDDVWLELQFCPTCGCTTHYTYTPDHPRDRVGVNMRLFVQDELAGIPVKWQDGRDVNDDSDEFMVTGRGQVGDGKAF